MAIIPSLAWLLLSPMAGKKSSKMPFEVFRQKTHKWRGCGSLPWGSRVWQGDMGEVDVTAEPWEPLAKQGTCKGSICCQKHLRRPLHSRGINVKSGKWWLRITQNQAERSWRMGKGRFGWFTGSTWAAAAQLWQVKNRGSECDPRDYKSQG